MSSFGFVPAPALSTLAHDRGIRRAKSVLEVIGSEVWFYIRRSVIASC